jgi:hypothetical protein
VNAAVPGNVGPWALTLDGVDDYVDAGSRFDLAGASFTTALWAKRGRSGTALEVVLGQGKAAQNQALQLGFRTNNHFFCSFYSNDLDTANAYADLDWHHWACTYDSTSGQRRLYQMALVAQDVATAAYGVRGALHLGHGPSGY